MVYNRIALILERSQCFRTTAHACILHRVHRTARALIKRCTNVAFELLMQRVRYFLNDSDRCIHSCRLVCILRRFFYARSCYIVLQSRYSVGHALLFIHALLFRITCYILKNNF